MAPIAGQPPTVAQATAGTDLVWKYHPRAIGTPASTATLFQFQQYRAREIDRAVKDQRKQQERDAKNAKRQREQDAKNAKKRR